MRAERESMTVALKNPAMTDGAEQPAGWTQTWTGSGRIKVSRDAATFHSAPASLALAAVGGAPAPCARAAGRTKAKGRSPRDRPFVPGWCGPVTSP